MNDVTVKNSKKEIMPEKLTRSMSMLGVTALGVGAMIGAGIFVLTGTAAGEAGPALILAFALNAIIALIVGACYAELATMMPKAGGAYIWAKPGLGSVFGFFAGWMSAFAQLIACSLYAAAFGSFSQRLLSDVTGYMISPLFKAATSVGIILLLLWVNFCGAGKTGRIEILITALKIAILLVISAFGFRVMFGNSDNVAAFTPFFPLGVGGLLSAMGITFIAFEGYEVIVQTGEEIKQPSSTIPRSIFLSIAIAVSIYLLIAVVMLGAVKAPEGQTVYSYLGQLKELGLMEAAGQFVPYGEIILLIAGMASTASALNATIYGSSRITFAMGRGGDLPSSLGRIHHTTHTPHIAIAVTGILMIIATITLPIEDIAASTNIMFLLVFVLVCASVIRLRKLWPDRERPFRVPLSPWLPAVGIISGLILSVWMLQISLTAWIVAVCWLSLGGIFFIVARGRNK
ncbi:MAG: amino acid permease [Pseudomonadales bacterium]|nr:amino acid permease [Pseudomonadales bacterium]